MTAGALTEVPLGLDIAFPNRPPCRIELGRLRCSRLVRQLAEALLEHDGPLQNIEVAAVLGLPELRLDKAIPGMVVRLLDALFPTVEAVLAFRVLVGLETGICPEGVDALRADCLEWVGAGEARIRWFKARASGQESHVFPSRGPCRPVGSSSAGWRYPPGPAASPRTPAPLWLFCGAAQHRPQQARFGWDARHAFVARHGLTHDDGRPLSLGFAPLRPTYFARHDRHWSGALRIDPNHSRRIEGDHYLAQSRASAPAMRSCTTSPSRTGSAEPARRPPRRAGREGAVTRPDRLDVDGWEVAQVELERSWSGRELPDRCSLYRSASTWTLVTVQRQVRYGGGDQPVSGGATITTSTFATRDELAEYVKGAYTDGAWVELLGAGYQNDAELYRAWGRSGFVATSTPPPSSTRTWPAAPGLFEGQPVPALARDLPGWENEAVAAMAAHLTASGFQILDDRPVLRLDDPKHDPVLGTLRVRRYGWDGCGVVRVERWARSSFQCPMRRRSTALCGSPLPTSRTPDEASAVLSSW